MKPPVQTDEAVCVVLVMRYVIIKHRRKINTPKINIMLHKFGIECIMDGSVFSVFVLQFLQHFAPFAPPAPRPLRFLFPCNPQFHFGT